MYRAQVILRTFLIILVALSSISIIHVTDAANNVESVDDPNTSERPNCERISLATCTTEISDVLDQSAASDGTSDSKPILYDDFEDSIYDLANGAVSPNGKWRSIDNGYGAMGVRTNDVGNNIFYLHPKAAERKNETYSALATTVTKYTDFTLTLEVLTEKQLRLNTPPNSWEAAWVLFRFTDIFHYYWLLLKPDGVELGKKDCNSCTDPVEGQIFLKRLDAPNLILNKWSKWDIQAHDNRIIATIDGNRIIDYVDNNASETLNSGSVALYTEDAEVEFDNIYISLGNSSRVS